MLQVSDVGRRQAGRPTWLGDCGTADRWHLVGDKQLTNQQEWLHRRCTHKRREVAGEERVHLCAEHFRSLYFFFFFFSPLLFCVTVAFLPMCLLRKEKGREREKKKARNTPVVVPL